MPYAENGANPEALGKVLRHPLLRPLQFTKSVDDRGNVMKYQEESIMGQWLGSDSLDRWQNRAGARVQQRRLDVVLLTHPRDEADFVRLFPWGERLSLEERRQVAQHLRPVFGEVISADRLSIGLLFLPVFAEEIMHPASRQRCRSFLKHEGMAAAVASGARVICLGGLLGSLSGYGRHVEEVAASAGMIVTTGHSLTSISVLQTYRRALAELALEPSAGSMAILGVGSVGGGFARLLADSPSVPRHVTLVDTPRRDKHLEDFAVELRKTGRFTVSCELTDRHGVLVSKSACYHSQFLVSAVSTPEVIDIGKVSPGTILIDDSQPYCWSREKAWERCRDQLDIVPCEAGLIDVGSIGYRSHFPFDFADQGSDGSRTAWCCLTEGLLQALDPGLPATLGEPTAATLGAYLAAFERNRLQPAILQCGENALPVQALRHALIRLGTPAAWQSPTRRRE
jgi:predicted amino acid dehydrogenase